MRDLQGITYSLGVCPQKPERAEVEIFFLSPPVEGSQATFLKAPGGGYKGGEQRGRRCSL